MSFPSQMLECDIKIKLKYKIRLEFKISPTGSTLVNSWHTYLNYDTDRNFQ